MPYATCSRHCFEYNNCVVRNTTTPVVITGQKRVDVPSLLRPRGTAICQGLWRQAKEWVLTGSFPLAAAQDRAFCERTFCERTGDSSSSWLCLRAFENTTHAFRTIKTHDLTYQGRH